MANAKKLIEQKKEQLGINKMVNNVLVSILATKFVVRKEIVKTFFKICTLKLKPQEDKQAALMALKAKLAASVASAEVQSMLDKTKATEKVQLSLQEQLVQRQVSAQERELSLNLIIDSEGRTVDKRTGQVVQIQSRVPTIKANIKTQKRDHKGPGGDKNDLFASGIASTISMSSGVMSVYPGGGIQSTLLFQSSSSSVLSQQQQSGSGTATAEPVSEQFFDNRLKFALFCSRYEIQIWSSLKCGNEKKWKICGRFKFSFKTV